MKHDHLCDDTRPSRGRAGLGPVRLAAGLSLLLAAAVAQAGAPTGDIRSAALPHVCKGGPSPGSACTVGSTTCGSGQCVVDLEKGKTWSGVLTLLVDDSASSFDVNNRSRTAITATLTLEVKVKGTTDILSKTFLNLDGATLSDVLSSLGNDGPKLADSALNVNETALITVVNGSQMMTQLLFQSGDATIAQALRDLLQTTGTPVVTKVVKIESFDHSPGTAEQNAATIVRAKVKGAVVNN